MANRHCGRAGCVLTPGHETLCHDGHAVVPDVTPKYLEPLSKQFRREVAAGVYASLCTEFSEADAELLRPVIDRAIKRDLYRFAFVWDRLFKIIRDSADDKAIFLTSCLQRHGLDVNK